MRYYRISPAFVVTVLLMAPTAMAQTASPQPAITQTASPQPAITQTASPQPAMTVPQILKHMSANTAGLSSYRVPVHIDVHVREGILSLPAPLDGDRYFKAPDKEALKLQGVPAIAKQFSNTYASLGTPATWMQTYNIVLQSTGDVDGHPVYTLRGTYKHQSRVDHVVLDVDSTTFDPVQARWFYTNGATIVMHIEEAPVSGQYRLPQRETLEVKFPTYQGTATVTYGQYQTNVPLSDSLFSK